MSVVAGSLKKKEKKEKKKKKKKERKKKCEKQGEHEETLNVKVGQRTEKRGDVE